MGRWKVEGGLELGGRERRGRRGVTFSFFLKISNFLVRHFISLSLAVLCLSCFLLLACWLVV